MKSFKQFISENVHPMIDIDGIKKHTTNSEGQRIHHTDDGIKSFHSWFGNSLSVDKHGRPKVLYRGMTLPYDKGVKKDVTWVTPSKDYANLYADPDSETGSNIMPIYAKIHKPINLGFGSQLTPVKYSEIKSRVMTRLMDQYQNKTISKEDALTAISHLTAGEKEHNSVHKPVYKWQDNDKHLHAALRLGNFDAIESKEGDSVILGNRPTHITYGILHPSHIKSAIGNTESFDINSNDIMESVACNEVIGFANAGGSKSQYDNFKIITNPHIGFANAGGPPQKIIKENLNPKNDKPVVINSKDEIFTDPEKHNKGLGEEQHKPENLIDDYIGNGYVIPHNNAEHAKNIKALDNTVQRTANYHDMVDAYTSNSDNLNKTLYDHSLTGATPPDKIASNLDTSRSDVEENPQIYLSKLDALIAKHKTPHAMTVYTGLHFDPYQHLGKVVHMPAYTSTSVNPHVASDFGKPFPQAESNGNMHHIKHIFRIELPKGQHHLFTDTGSNYPGQGEVILPRGIKLQVGRTPTHIINGNFNEHFTDRHWDNKKITHMIWNARILKNSEG